MTTSCLVTQRLGVYASDGPDDDSQPDWVPISGKVRFVPNVRAGDSFTVTDESGEKTVPAVIYVAEIRAGILYHNDEVGIRLFAAGPNSNPKKISYKAQYFGLTANDVPITLRDVIFEAIPGGEIDLTTVTPVAGTPAMGITRGEPGHSPYIGENGNWWVDGKDTGVKVTGPEGYPGVAPYILNGTWWVQETDLGVSASGPQGEKGDPGPTGTLDLIDESIQTTIDTVAIPAIESARDDALSWVEGSVDSAVGEYFERSTNLFNPATITEGWVLPEGSGTPTENAMHSLSAPIPVVAGGTYTSYRPIRASFFTGTTFLSSQNLVTGEAQTWVTPAGATSVRLTILNNYLPSAQLNAGSVLLAYEPWYPPHVPADRLDLTGVQPVGDYIEGEVTPEKTSFFEGAFSTNLFDQTKVTPGVVIPSLSATPVSNAQYVVSDPIPVVAGRTYSVASFLRLTWMDSAGSHVATTNYSTVNPAPHPVAPAGAVTVRISVSTAMVSTCQLNVGDVLLPYEPGGGGGDLKIPARYLDIPTPEPGESTTYDPFLVDTSGLEEIFTAPTLSAYPGLASVPAADVYGWYDQLVTDHPGYVTRRDLGVMSDGTTHMYAYTLKPEPVPTLPNGAAAPYFDTPLPTALLMAGTHGYEETGPYCIWRLAQALCKEWDTSPVLDAMRWNVEMIFIPLVNPVGWDKPTTAEKRKNGNGVDLARNFAAGWVASDPTSGTYSGTAPLSEPETQAIDALMVEVADRCVFGGSFHNFSGNASIPWTMLWQAAASPMMLNLGKKIIARMSRKWRKEQTWITIPDTYFGYSDLGSPPGSEGQALVAHGIPGSTFETSQWCYLDGTSGAKYDSRVMTLSYEAVVNYIAMGLSEGLRLKSAP